MAVILHRKDIPKHWPLKILGRWPRVGLVDPTPALLTMRVSTVEHEASPYPADGLPWCPCSCTLPQAGLALVLSPGAGWQTTFTKPRRMTHAEDHEVQDQEQDPEQGQDPAYHDGPGQIPEARHGSTQLPQMNRRGACGPPRVSTVWPPFA
jgi:hypothetical protein